jgi:hypothetical protein
LVTDPAALAEIEHELPLRALIALPPSTDRSNAALAKEPEYAAIVEVLRRDLADLVKRDRTLAPGMKSTHRLFDLGWLTSKDARFELVGIAQRLDRHPFNREACGEIRFVHRLAYRTVRNGVEITSRLPMTLNVVHFATGEDCRAVAERWIVPGDREGAALARALLERGALTGSRLKSVELNLQSVRWPSTIRPDMAGHAEYLLRVFTRDGKRMVPATLENTPDVDKISRDPTLKRELLALLRSKESLAKIDEGTFVLPENLLAKKAETFAPRSLGRLGNQPFSRIFGAKDFGELDLSRLTFVKTPRALLRRLDDLSCTGCHQARSIAGFHLLGVDPPDTVAGNSIAVAASPHVVNDLPRRERYLRSWIDRTKPNDSRAFSDRALEELGGWGAHCGLGDPSFERWTCAEGLTCRAINTQRGAPLVGQCFPKEAPEAGDACSAGVIVPSADPHKDKVVEVARSSCGDRGVCEENAVGFPNGMCALDCEGKDANTTCGVIAILDGFNKCLAKNRPFGECIRDNVRPAGLRKCDDAHPCRDDYICARTPEGEGACVPPYFLFQLRVDGHPKAR